MYILCTNLVFLRPDHINNERRNMYSGDTWRRLRETHTRQNADHNIMSQSERIILLFIWEPSRRLLYTGLAQSVVRFELIEIIKVRLLIAHILYIYTYYRSGNETLLSLSYGGISTEYDVEFGKFLNLNQLNLRSITVLLFLAKKIGTSTTNGLS